MKTGKTLKRRVFAIVLAMMLTAGMIPQEFAATQAKAASSGNNSSGYDALKAIGINTDKMPEGFDEDDTSTNPYGKITTTLQQSDEVFVATMGMPGSAIIGEDMTEPTGKHYTYDNAPQGEGEFLMTYRNGTGYSPETGTRRNSNSEEVDNYLSELVLGVGTSDEEAKSELTDRGYSIVTDVNGNPQNMNQGNNGKKIYLGYKTTRSAHEAITEVSMLALNGSFNLGGTDID